ncbi:hypothetical protein B005_2090 [Nocardiopsis alba ATCC BAA-2165]|uniref:Uncharacterized protein n=2 Tax=Nocardiopsis TaxID=2013 RepID=J7LGL8_NOCAA|nr:hypothetical protein B005_2090 [Nocardiopsis alba ATCC BAA-2165]
MNDTGSVDRWMVLRHGVPNLAVFLLLSYAGWAYALAALLLWYTPMFIWVARERRRHAADSHRLTSSAEGESAI